MSCSQRMVPFPESVLLCSPVTPSAAACSGQAATYFLSGNRPGQKLHGITKIIFREIWLFKDIQHKGSGGILWARCWRRLDHPSVVQLALLIVGRQPESISKKAILFK